MSISLIFEKPNTDIAPILCIVILTTRHSVLQKLHNNKLQQVTRIPSPTFIHIIFKNNS